MDDSGQNFIFGNVQKPVKRARVGVYSSLFSCSFLTVLLRSRRQASRRIQVQTMRGNGCKSVIQLMIVFLLKVVSTLSTNVPSGPNLQTDTSARYATMQVVSFRCHLFPLDIRASLDISCATVQRDMLLGIRVVRSREKDTSAGRVEAKAITSTIVLWQMCAHRGNEEEEEDVGHRRKSLVRFPFYPRTLALNFGRSADECWFCLSSPNLAYVSFILCVSQRLKTLLVNTSSWLSARNVM